MYKDLTGIILAGGESRRMSKNKALMKLGELTVIERMVEIIEPLFKEIFIITNTPSEFEFLNLPIYQDVYRFRGPIAGIHSGMLHSLWKRSQ